MHKYTIIVAGGSGSRFGSTIPKQFTLLCGKPILMHTISAFHNYDKEMKIVVALPSEHITLWNDLCTQYEFKIKHDIVEGGENRFGSVKNALTSITDADGLVAIHDGARPLVTQRCIDEGFQTAERCGTAVPTVPITDSIRMLDRKGSHMIDRDSLVAIQTPQIFNLRLLKTAYTTPFSPTFTDDASVVEFRGSEITLYSGDFENIKITHPTDVKTAELILSERNE